MIKRRKVKVKVNKAEGQRLRRKLRGHYHVVAERAGVSWHMVWSVLNDHKTSARVLEIAREVAEEVA